MANRGLVYGYDTDNNQNVRLRAFNDGALGVSLNAAISATISDGATEAKQDTMISTLAGISSNIELTVPGVSGPTAYHNTATASGASTTKDIEVGNYRNLTIFGKTSSESSWKLIYKTSSGDYFEELDSTTAQESDSSTSGGSYAFSQNWNNVGAQTVGLLNAGTDTDTPDFYYSLTR